MEMQTYQASSMAEALAKVKQALGPDAVILHTRTLTKGGVLGVGVRTVVEITASRDFNALPPAERRAMIGPGGRRSGADRDTKSDMGRRGVRDSQAEGAAMSRPARATAEHSSRAEMAAFTSALQGEMGQLRAMVRELLNRSPPAEATSPVPDVPQELREYYTHLIQNEVAEELVRELIGEAQDRLRDWRAQTSAPAPTGTGEGKGPTPGADAAQVADQQPGLSELAHEVLVEGIERMLPPAEPVQLNPDRGPKYLALVGPTGVGKTTTIAKLAAHFKLREAKRVGLITIDTYRIAAVQQLRSYADILGVPLEVVLTPEEITTALESMRDCDLVLIDTSGRSQRDARRLDELSVFLDVARNAGTAPPPCEVEPGVPRNVVRGPDGRFQSGCFAGGATASLEVHLVLSCTAHPAQLVEVAEKFSVLGIDRVVFTKLDEAVGLGVILNVIRGLNLRLSYLTTGQDVPDDIEVGHRRRIAELVLGGCAGAASPFGESLRRGPVVDHVA